MRLITIALFGLASTGQVLSLSISRHGVVERGIEDVIVKRANTQQSAPVIEAHAPTSTHSIARSPSVPIKHATYGQNALGHAQRAAAHAIGIPVSMLGFPVIATGSAIASLAAAPYHYWKGRPKLATQHLAAATIGKPLAGAIGTIALPTVHLYHATKHTGLAIKDGVTAGLSARSGNRVSGHTIDEVRERTKIGWNSLTEPAERLDGIVPYSSEGLMPHELRFGHR